MKFHKTLTLLLLATELIFALATWAQQKPFTQEQVVSMVRNGFGDESGAKLIEQRGIDFTPSDGLPSVPQGECGTRQFRATLEGSAGTFRRCFIF